jgi:3-(3-hydroxy-phenyl)propionate hydroxylase
MKHDYPTIRRALFDPDCRRDGTVLIHKQPDDIWRIDYQITETESIEDSIKEETVRSSIEAVLKDIGYSGDWQLEWWSNYSANTLALDEYRHGPVFFIGDSAHIVPIFGVRGLNNGLADAQNIGWKLAFLINKKANERLLESYNSERRGATLDVFANATKSTRFMTPPTYGWLTMRDAALSLALRHKFAGVLANPRQMEPYSYAKSSITMPDDENFLNGPKPGTVMENFSFNDKFLSDMLDKEFNILWFGEKPKKYNRKDYPNLICLDPQSKVGELYGASNGSSYLIRPDMHILGRWYKTNLNTVLSTYEKVLNGVRL